MEVINDNEKHNSKILKPTCYYSLRLLKMVISTFDTSWKNLTCKKMKTKLKDLYNII